MSNFNFVMISAGFEHGGNVTHRHLDGHPQLLVYPFESQLGNRDFKDFLGINLNKINNNQNFISDDKKIDNNEILNLKNELNKAKKIIEQQKLTIDDLQTKLNNSFNFANNYQNIINQKDLEINNLKSQLKNINTNSNVSNNFNVNFNDIVSVNFISSDSKIQFAITSLKTNTFAEIEEKLYKKYPEYRETNNNFLAKGKVILKFKTIAENKIDDGSPITLIVPS